MTLAHAVVPAPAPIGALTVGATEVGLALVAFGDRPDAAQRAAARLGLRAVPDTAATDEAAEQLNEYLAGRRRAFTVALDWRLASGAGRGVLETLYDTVPFGATVTYGELTTRGGWGDAHAAARGVGAIMGSNPLPVVVPCHRVMSAAGLGGFGGGRAVKEWLLALEGVLTPALEFG